MKDVTTEFFENLARRGYDPEVAGVNGKLRFDIQTDKRTTRWTVTLKSGTIRVSHEAGKADAVLRADKRSFERIISGETTALTSVLRGAVSAEGDPTLLVLFQRLFRGKPQPARA